MFDISKYEFIEDEDAWAADLARERKEREAADAAEKAAKAETAKIDDVVAERLKGKRIATPTSNGPLTPKQVAGKLILAKPETVLAFIRDGELKATNVGEPVSPIQYEIYGDHLLLGPSHGLDVPHKNGKEDEEGAFDRRGQPPPAAGPQPARNQRTTRVRSCGDHPKAVLFTRSAACSHRSRPTTCSGSYTPRKVTAVACAGEVVKEFRLVANAVEIPLAEVRSRG